MSPSEIPISGTTLRRPARCFSFPPRRDSDTLQFEYAQPLMPASDNPLPFPVPYINQYSRGVASSDVFPSANSYLLSTQTPQTPQTCFTLPLVFRFIYSYIRTTLAADVLPLLGHLLKLPFDLLGLILDIKTCIPRFYSSRFAFSNICPHSAAERGDIGHVGPQWAKQAQAVNTDYVKIATGSSGAFSVGVTVLQLQVNAYVTTLIIFAFIFIIHAIACSVMYIAYDAVLSGPGVALVWSQDNDDTVLLWQLLALPLQFVLSAAAFTCAAMLFFAWSYIGNAGPAGGDTTPTGPVTTLPASGASSAPPPSAMVPGPDLADRLSIPLRQALVTLIIIYGIWKIINARKKLADMARKNARVAPVRGAIEVSRETEAPSVGNSS